MIRILVQKFSGENPSENYRKSYQFKVTNKIDEGLALDMLLD